MVSGGGFLCFFLGFGGFGGEFVFGGFVGVFDGGYGCCWEGWMGFVRVEGEGGC